MSLLAKETLYESLFGSSRQKCLVCDQTRYAHQDHDHTGLTASDGKCPFRDCGDFKEPKDA